MKPTWLADVIDQTNTMERKIKLKLNCEYQHKIKQIKH